MRDEIDALEDPDIRELREWIATLALALHLRIQNGAPIPRVRRDMVVAFQIDESESV